MAERSKFEDSGRVGVVPPTPGLQLRHNWTDQRPDRLLQHASSGDPNTGVDTVAAALAAVALVGIAAFVMVVLFAF